MAKKIETPVEVTIPAILSFTEEEATAVRLGLKTVAEIISERK